MGVFLLYGGPLGQEQDSLAFVQVGVLDNQEMLIAPVVQVVPDMGTKTQVGAVDLPLTALDSQETPGAVDKMKAAQAVPVVLTVLDFDIEEPAGVVDTPLEALLAVPAKEAVPDIDTDDD